MSKAPGPMVEVEWVDPGGINGWHDPSQNDEAWERVLEPIRSLGFLVEDSDRGVVIVNGYGRGGESYDNSTIIPRPVVRSVTRLRRGG
jgi:hypothetical protein